MVEKEDFTETMNFDNFRRRQQNLGGQTPEMENVFDFPPEGSDDDDVEAFTRQLDTSAFDADFGNDQPRAPAPRISVHEMESFRPDGTRIVRRETVDDSGFVLDVKEETFPPVQVFSPTMFESDDDDQPKAEDEEEDATNENQTGEVDEEGHEEQNHEEKPQPSPARVGSPLRLIYKPRSVDSVDDASEGTGEDDVEEEKALKKDCGKSRSLMLRIAVVTVLAIIIIGATIGATTNSTSSNDTNEGNAAITPSPVELPTSTPPPTPPQAPSEPTPTASPTTELSAMVADLAAVVIPNDDFSQINFFSSTYRALEWLVEDDVSGVSLSENSIELQERFAIVSFYFALNGKGWLNKRNWMSAQSVCRWNQITCDENSRVIGISFNANNLQGSLPTALGKLDQLKVVSLPQNSLVGGLPTEFGLLTNCEQINFYSNGFTAQLPTEIGNMRSMKELVLWKNDMQGTLPSELGRMSMLTNLDLAENQFEGSVPSELGRLTNLVKLFLDNNNLGSVLPSELGRMQNLELLHARANSFTGFVPQEMQDAPKLLDVFLDANSFIGGFESLFCDRDMIKFYSDCGDGALICRCCTHCCAMRLDGCFEPFETRSPTTSPTGMVNVFAELLLPFNKIQPVLSDPQSPQYKALEWISEDYLPGLAIERTPDLEERFGLATLYYATGGETDWINTGNWLTIGLETCSWTFVTCLGSRVRFLRLSGNNLQGSIPEEIELLSSLRSLELGRNGITSTIPSDLGRLSFLSNLELFDNNLSGIIPQSLMELSFLTTLNAANNRLGGTIPTTVSQLFNLRNLRLSSNILSGTIPTEIGDLLRLVTLELGENQLDGTLPSELGRLTLLNALRLNSNSFESTIPEIYARMIELQAFEAQGNALTGTIPSIMFAMPMMGYFRVSSNRLEGTLHTNIGSLSRLTYFNVQQNAGISGSLPSELGLLTTLTSFSVAFTNISGSVPIEIGGLSTLQTILVHGTQVSAGLDGSLFCNPVRSSFFSDCRGAEPEVRCTCCNFCCLGDGTGCSRRF